MKGSWSSFICCLFWGAQESICNLVPMKSVRDWGQSQMVQLPFSSATAPTSTHTHTEVAQVTSDTELGTPG